MAKFKIWTAGEDNTEEFEARRVVMSLGIRVDCVGERVDGSIAIMMSEANWHLHDGETEGTKVVRDW